LSVVDARSIAVNVLRHTHLLAEQTTLNRLLAEIPADGVLERSGLEARLEDVERELATFGPARRDRARARLTFRGRPVVDQHGIFAEFGTRATSAFTDAVAKVAAGLSGPLAAMGPIPNRDESQLLITGTALGSFGFELEEAPSNLLEFEEPTIAGQALELTQGLLQSTLGTDDELADSAVATDPRAIAAVRNFLEILATNEAVCALQLNDKLFQFKDLGEVNRSVQRLGRDNLLEEQTQLTGKFQGVLPKARTFEFKLEESAEVIRGKVGTTITNPEVLNEHLDQATQIDVLATRVGTGNPRYVLMKMPRWQNARE
jgi:hypothetical protein